MTLDQFGVRRLSLTPPLPARAPLVAAAGRGSGLPAARQLATISRLNDGYLLSSSGSRMKGCFLPRGAAGAAAGPPFEVKKPGLGPLSPPGGHRGGHPRGARGAARGRPPRPLPPPG